MDPTKLFYKWTSVSVKQYTFLVKLYFPKITSMLTAIPLALLTVWRWHLELGRFLWLFPPLESSGRDAKCLLRLAHKRLGRCHDVQQTCLLETLIAVWGIWWQVGYPCIKSPNQPPQRDCMEQPWADVKWKGPLQTPNLPYSPSLSPLWPPSGCYHVRDPKLKSSVRHFLQKPNGFHCFKSLNFGVTCLS